MIHIAFIVTRSDSIGGSHIHVRDIAKAMANEGYRVSVLIGGEGPVTKHYRSIGLNPIIIPNLIREISILNDLKALFQIKRILSNLKPDLVSTHSSKAGVLGRVAAYLLGIPVIFTAHGWAFTEGKKRISKFIFEYIEKLVAPLTAKVITVSEYDRRLALDYLNLPEDAVITIHNGMPEIDEHYQAKFDEKNYLDIVKIARFDHQKDHSALLEAVAGIEKVRLHFIGDGPLMGNVADEAKRLGIYKSIIFYGEITSVEEVLARGQLFVLISKWEGFPRSTLEAMRAGLPVIVSDAGGASEAVIDGETGFIVQKGDIEGLTKRILFFRDNCEKRELMGSAGKRRFMQNYTFEIMYKKTISLYHEILRKKDG